MEAHDDPAIRLASERSWAATRGLEYAEPIDLGLRWDPVAPIPHVVTGSHRAFVLFYLDDPDPDWDGTWVRVVDPSDETVVWLGLVELVGCTALRIAPPGGDDLDGHRLFGHGLVPDEAHVVRNSRWMSEMAEGLAVNDEFDAEAFFRKCHFLFAFQEETLEAIADDFRVESRYESPRALLSQALGRLFA